VRGPDRTVESAFPRKIRSFDTLALACNEKAVINEIPLRLLLSKKHSTSTSEMNCFKEGKDGTRLNNEEKMERENRSQGTILLDR
jgi:hypothetical protein